MNKPNSLKQHLMSAVPDLRNNPDKLLVFIDQGSVRSTMAAGLSFEYSYTLNVILTDFPGHPDAIMLPLIAWMKVNMSDLMGNLDKSKDAIRFEADILANDLVDLSITLPITERVNVKPRDGGGFEIEHLAEPPLTPHWPVTPMRLYAGGELVAEWDSAPPVNVDLETPHPGPNRG